MLRDSKEQERKLEKERKEQERKILEERKEQEKKAEKERKDEERKVEREQQMIFMAQLVKLKPPHTHLDQIKRRDRVIVRLALQNRLLYRVV